MLITVCQAVEEWGHRVAPGNHGIWRAGPRIWTTSQHPHLTDGGKLRGSGTMVWHHGNYVFCSKPWSVCFFLHFLCLCHLFHIVSLPYVTWLRMKYIYIIYINIWTIPDIHEFHNRNFSINIIHAIIWTWPETSIEINIRPSLNRLWLFANRTSGNKLRGEILQQLWFSTMHLKVVWKNSTILSRPNVTSVPRHRMGTDLLNDT